MEKTSLKKVGLKYGIYLALVSIIYSILLQIMGLAANQTLGYVGLIFLIVALILAHKEFKDSNEFMSYGQALGISMIIVSINAVISAIFTYLYLKFVDDSMIGMIRDKAMETMEKRGMSDTQIDQALQIQSKFMTPEWILIWGILGGIFFGFIISLIISAITKKSPPEVQMS